MSEWDDTPLRERDLPNAELMLSRILRDAAHDHVTVDELDELDAPPARRRWLYAVAAAVMVIALGMLGWLVTRPDTQTSAPLQRPTIPAETTITPTPEPEPSATPSTAPTTSRPPTPTPTPDTSPTDEPTDPATTAGTTPGTGTASGVPAPEASATVATDGPTILVLTSRREPSPQSGMDYVHVRYELCSGSGEATVVGPVSDEPGVSVTTLTPPAEFGPRLGSGGRFGPGECIPRGVTLLVDDRLTTVTFGVLFTYPADTPEARHNGLHSITFVIGQD